ncbi:hypothetical protein Slin14017_G128260 [Septoria linicola]|nr:hypothetical protein Slin14017_G128260 [Septoria linicola]
MPNTGPAAAIKPADRLNIALQRLGHSAPTYAQEVHATYRVKIHLSDETHQLFSMPGNENYKKLADAACSGKFCKTSQASKLQGIAALCTALEMMTDKAAEGTASGDPSLRPKRTAMSRKKKRQMAKASTSTAPGTPTMTVKRKSDGNSTGALFVSQDEAASEHGMDSPSSDSDSDLAMSRPQKRVRRGSRPILA